LLLSEGAFGAPFAYARDMQAQALTCEPITFLLSREPEYLPKGNTQVVTGSRLDYLTTAHVVQYRLCNLCNAGRIFRRRPKHKKINYSVFIVTKSGNLLLVAIENILKKEQQ
tara:strand:- start:13016 stop:13351 length:336 start_codon:yes stop_codon:yes gene_type:complete